MEDAATREVVARAQASPEDFVLKPQREGGGNNMYGEQLQQRLGQGTGLAAYILMQRIRPPINRPGARPCFLSSNEFSCLACWAAMILRAGLLGVCVHPTVYSLHPTQGSRCQRVVSGWLLASSSLQGLQSAIVSFHPCSCAVRLSVPHSLPVPSFCEGQLFLGQILRP